MSEEESKNRGTVVGHHHEPQYGTFQGVANYPPHHLPPPPIGFPHPVPPPGAADPSAPPPIFYQQGYQTVPGYAVAEGRPVRERRLPCCGIGLGWFMFIIGFFLAAIPWYVGVFILMCSRIDHREKPGYIACTIAFVVLIFTSTDTGLTGFHLIHAFIDIPEKAILVTIAVIIEATKGGAHHHRH